MGAAFFVSVGTLFLMCLIETGPITGVGFALMAER